MKKLFSYLLISSMVVLSSCTNYDDQFDDLNTQINTLKSQIEGFSSLSSGLTALQGTVASLQTAIANIPVTPATDVSGLATAANLTALDTALTALAAEVTALTTSLANAATSAEVSALATSLATAQADLADLLAANNVYTTTTLVIDSASSLTVAKALGNKLAIINGSVTISHTAAAAMNATDLQAVVDKMVTITGKLDYTHSGASVTGIVFNNLTGTGDLDLDQNAPISLPKLVTAAAVDFTSTSSLKVTSVSAPMLTTVTSLVDVNLPQATSFSMPKFVGETLNKTLNITLKAKSTIDLTAYNTLDAATGKEVAGHELKLVGPSAVTLPNWVTSATNKLDTDAEVLTLVKAKAAPKTYHTKLKEVHLHNLQEPVTFDTTYSKLEIVDIIGTYDAEGLAATVAGARATDVTLGSSNIETLTLAGALGNVTITNASSLASVTTSGGMRSFSLTGATSLTELTLGHGANASSTLKKSDLIISGATSLTKLTAEKINYANTLTIEDNVELTTVSLPGLLAISTEVDAAKKALVPAVQIDNNKFTIQSFQLPSEYLKTPVVTGKITSDSGLNALSKYFDLAIAATGSTVYVEYDAVAKALDAAGNVYETGAALGDNVSEQYAIATAEENTVTVVADNSTAFVAVNITPDTRKKADVKAVYQTNSEAVAGTLSDMSSGDTTFTFLGDAADAAVTAVTINSAFRTGISDYDRSDLSTYMPEIAAALQANINAKGLKYTLTAEDDYGTYATYSVNAISTTGVADNTAASLSTSGYVYVSINGGTVVSGSIGSNANQAGIVDGIVNAFHKPGSPLSATWSATDNNNTVIIKKLKTINGGASSVQDLAFTNYGALAFSVYGGTNTSTNALLSGASIRTSAEITKGWRFKVVNTDQDFKAAKLEAGLSFITLGGSGHTGQFTTTAVGSEGQYTASSGTMQIGFTDVKKADTSTVVSGLDNETTDYTAWM